MIPFIKPQTGEILNLSQIVRMRIIRPHDDPNGAEVEVHLSDGTTRIYADLAASIVLGEIGFSLDTYRKYQAACTSPLLGADGNSPARIM